MDNKLKYGNKDFITEQKYNTFFLKKLINIKFRYNISLRISIKNV